VDREHSGSSRGGRARPQSRRTLRLGHAARGSNTLTIRAIPAAASLVSDSSGAWLGDTTFRSVRERMSLAHSDLRSVAKDGGHQPRIPAPMENRHNPKRLLVRCVRDKVLIARDMESKRTSRQVRASMSNLW